ncbi:MAG: methylmalonyl-CoA mutase family protein [Solirubrobacterales bacterium]
MSRRAEGAARPVERKEEFRTDSGIPVRASYGPEDLDLSEYGARVGEPGEYPFTRGLHPTMYRSRLWTRRQVVGLGTAAETNLRHKYVLANGQTGLSNDFDHPTLIGLDSGDPAARHEVGRVGVAIDTVHDMEDLFADIPLDRIDTSFTINHPSPVILAMYAVVAEQRGVPAAELKGTLQNDPLKEIYAQKTFVFPPRPAVRFACDTIAYCAREMPRMYPISISAYQARDAGGTADLEVALGMAEATVYIERLLDMGLDIDEFAPRMSFLFNIKGDFFEEIAKFRAARRVWARIIRERFGARDDRSCWLRVHAQTSGASLVAQEPENNVIRGTVQALAAAIGGVQSMAVSCYDEAYSIPSEHAQRTSLRVQEILAHETGIGDVVDPIAGSFFVESLTDQLEERVWGWLEDFDSHGGMVPCVESGYIEQLIADQAYEYDEAMRSGERIVVGVNDREAPTSTETPIEVFRTDPAAEQRQIEKVARARANRDQAAADEALAAVGEAAAGEANIMPPILAAVRAEATLGEIMGALKEVVGTHRPTTIF